MPDDVQIDIASEGDIVVARQEGRSLAARMDMTRTDAVLLATAISEVARNIVQYAEKGEIVLGVIAEEGREGIVVVARDTGPGFEADEVLDDESRGPSPGLGLPGARRLMDDFEIESEVGRGTTVTMRKWKG
ncbi:MAG: ATP-binding protein [Actinomycetota bacterium]|nr:ATP-binding protein [Actinomycetota bacterium]